jgi:hypothetical protein
MVEGARVETWELILLMLEQLDYTNPFHAGKVDKYLPDGQPTLCDTSHLGPYQNLKSCNDREILVTFWYKVPRVAQDSSVGIATRYWLDGLGIESRWGKILRTRPDRPWDPPSLLYSGYRVFPGCKAAGPWR